MQKLIGLTALTLFTISLSAQEKDSVKNLPDIKVVGYKTMNGVGHVDDYSGQIIFSGKKNELLNIDSLDANKALNNTRQIIGRIPGVSIIETEAGGFTSNGIAFRGLNPYQSIELNSRQNGYNVSADVFGYNEAYYIPPMEAVQSVQLLRGSSALQFGPQIGGMVNYILKQAPDLPLQLTVSQTGGGCGLYNGYTSLGGTFEKIKYFGFIQYRKIDGWRDNSDQQQISGFGKVSYDFSSRLQISLEYTLLRNKIHMPGGLTDSQFYQDAKQSSRSRNWLQSPWNILASNISYVFSKNTTLNLKTSFLFSERNLVWRSEDGWPEVADTITPSLSYVPRELEREYFKSITNELRLITQYKIGNINNTIAYGIRYAYANLKRQEAGDGSTGTSFDLTPYSDYGVNLRFNTTNIAPFAENIINLGEHFSVTPGIRFEYLTTAAEGLTEDEDNNDEPLKVNNVKQSRTFILAGSGIQYKFSQKINAYGNYTQSYKPITYSDLTPFGSIAKVDPYLKDSKGDNMDIGIRGQIKNLLNFDVSFFYLNYKNRIGLIERNDNQGNLYAFRTNTGSSEHKGIETYGELNINKLLFPDLKNSKLSIYNSFAYVNAKYKTGEFKGNSVEYAPELIERVGINYWYKGFTANAQYSYQSQTFGDASNTPFSEDALIGLIPAYHVVDISASYKWSQYQFRFGVNNLTNSKYFTLRTSEYPGPGIIPALGRMFYAGISLTF